MYPIRFKACITFFMKGAPVVGDFSVSLLLFRSTLVGTSVGRSKSSSLIVNYCMI